MENNSTRSLYNFYPKQSIRLTNINNLTSRNFFIPPADPLIERKNIPLNPPKFGKNYTIVDLPSFNNYINDFDEEFFLEKKDRIQLSFQEYILDLYINSNKMLKKLVYYKENFNNEGKVTIENIVNLRELEKKRNKKKKNEINIENLIRNNGFNIEETLIFESKFESGNLQLAYFTQKMNDEDNIDKIDKYQLFLHNDTNTNGYTQWFFFRVKNMKKDKRVNFNIMNMLRKTSKYCYGIKIWVFSKKGNLIEKKTWHHTIENVKYYKNNLYRIYKGGRQYYYSLSFDYTSKYDNDEIYFANCIPFTYTDLMKDLNYYTKYENNKYPFFHRKTLCQTIGGNDIDYITINNSYINNAFNNDKNRKVIFLIARQHPSETVGSWKIKGAIKFLLGNSDEAKYLRDNFIFKIIPMINVDGVISGNTRTSFSGCDLNRRWINPNEFLHPEIFYTKNLIHNFSLKYSIECIIDFHGHFGAFNSFFYGNYIYHNFEACKFFPFTCSKLCDIINFDKCKFKMPKYKNGTGRIHLFKEYNIENVFTLETSYFGCISGKYANQYFDTEKLENIGRDVCIGILYLFYHNNLKDGIKNISLKNELKDKIEKNYNQIEKEFNEYIEKKKKEKLNENENEDEDKEKSEKEYSISSNESDSESEPSGDNLSIEEIQNLLPINSKRKKNKKRKSVRQPLHVISKKNQLLELNLSDNNNKLSQPLKTVNYNNSNNMKLPKVNVNPLTEKKNQNSNSKRKNLFSATNRKKPFENSINSFSNNHNNNKEITINNIKTNTNNKDIIINNHLIDSQTQTEQIFFKMHWTYFLGTYNIITPKINYKNYLQNNSIDYIFEKKGYGVYLKTRPKTINKTNSGKKIINNMKNNFYNFEKKANRNYLSEYSLNLENFNNNHFQAKSPKPINFFYSKNNIIPFDINNNKK